jgi:hypothetical protein
MSFFWHKQNAWPAGGTCCITFLQNRIGSLEHARTHHARTHARPAPSPPRESLTESFQTSCRRRGATAIARSDTHNMLLHLLFVASSWKTLINPPPGPPPPIDFWDQVVRHKTIHWSLSARKKKKNIPTKVPSSLRLKTPSFPESLKKASTVPQVLISTGIIPSTIPQILISTGISLSLSLFSFSALHGQHKCIYFWKWKHPF